MSHRRGERSKALEAKMTKTIPWLSFAALLMSCAGTQILDYCGKTCSDDCPADYTCEVESGTCVAKDGHCSVEDGGGAGGGETGGATTGGETTGGETTGGETTGGETTGGTGGTSTGGSSGSTGTTG
jgi:hypothetical protein